MNIENLKAYMRGGEWAGNEALKQLERKILYEVLQPIPDQQKIDSLTRDHYREKGIQQYITDLLETFPELKTNGQT